MSAAPRLNRALYLAGCGLYLWLIWRGFMCAWGDSFNPLSIWLLASGHAEPTLSFIEFPVFFLYRFLGLMSHLVAAMAVSQVSLWLVSRPPAGMPSTLATRGPDPSESRLAEDD